MNIFNKFCCCFDLRKGCLIYAWLQMIIITIFTAKLLWISNVIKMKPTVITVKFIVGQFDLISAIQLIKILTSLPLIWGLIKTQHMFLEPWLFINGVENIIFIIFAIVFFICGFVFDYDFIIYGCIPFTIITVTGCYIWSRVYIVYKRDKLPNIISFEESPENITTQIAD